MIFRVSVLLVASVSAFALAHINIHCSRRRNSSNQIPRNDGSSFQHEQNKERDKFEDSNVESHQEEEVKSNRSKTKHELKQSGCENSDCMSSESQIYDEKGNYIREIELLKNVVKEMEQRRVILELKLLDLYGLREQQLDIAQLQNQSEVKTAKIGMLNDTVEALQAERKKLHEEIKQNQLAEKQLEVARKRILEMQAKLRVDASQMKGQLMMLEGQVSGFRMEETTIRDAGVENKLRAIKDLQMEVVEMKRRNRELQLEKRDLVIKLAASQARITALLNMTESKIVAEIEAEISSLRHANEELSKQADRLQQDRFGMVEELMYQRWLNACLGFEIQDSHNPQWKNPKSHLSKNLSTDQFHKKAKQPSSDSTLDSISSRASCSESDENTGSTLDSSSSSQKSAPKKSSLIHKMKRWGRSKDLNGPISSPGSSAVSQKGLIRRFSMSTVPSNTSVLLNNGGNVKEPETSLIFQRRRRVSFNDSVQTVASTFDHVMPKSVQGVLNNEQTSTERLENSTIMNTSYRSTCISEEKKSEFSSPAFINVIEAEASSNLSKQDIHNENNNEETRATSKSDIALEEPGMPNVPSSNKQVGAQKVHLVAALFFFFFFLLMLLVCFVLFTGGAY